MRQMPVTPTSTATAIATAKPAKMRVLTLRARIAASTLGSCSVGSRIGRSIDRSAQRPKSNATSVAVQWLLTERIGW